MTQKHTPGPWTSRNDHGQFAIIGAEPSWICAVDKKAHNAEANAAFIVRACNSHYELLELLKETLGDVGDVKFRGKILAAIANATGAA